MVLAVVDDLLFSSKIRAAAGATARSVVFVRRDAVITAIRAQGPELVILDLDRDALDPIGLIREIRSVPDFAATRIVGFGSHVRVQRLQQARDAGCDQVMARSGFVAALPALIGATAGQAS